MSISVTMHWHEHLPDTKITATGRDYTGFTELSFESEGAAVTLALPLRMSGVASLIRDAFNSHADRNLDAEDALAKAAADVG